MSHKKNCTTLLFAFLAVFFAVPEIVSAQENKVIRLGMIGLDTSHVIRFTEWLNNPANGSTCKVVAAYKGGSDIPSSANRIDKFTNQLKDQFQVEIVPTLEELCAKVDGFLLESVDGRQHLEQFKQIVTAGKPVFIDKPMAASAAEVIEIFTLAKKHNVPVWCSSSLRYGPQTLALKASTTAGPILSCETFGPCKIEPYISDLYWYGIHGVEALFTIMGPGCESVRRVHTADTDLVIGVWKDGRIGTYRGLRKGEGEVRHFGGFAICENEVVPCGDDTNYEPLCKQFTKFFETGVVPVNPEETIEIYAFMDAAQISKEKNGEPVSLLSIFENAMNKTSCSENKSDSKCSASQTVK